MFITFLSDFGLKDDFVGTCHGVMKTIAPDAQIIDITHGIPPQAVLEGALVLANTIGYMPVGVHLAVVDPGVGGPRRPLALRDRDGRLFVGPDNGLLLPAASRVGIADAHELANPQYALQTISRTFHGRDLFSPAAAHLANGVSLEELGPPLDPEALVSLDVPEPVLAAGAVVATLLYVDSFGNVALNLKREHVEQMGIVSGAKVELELAGERYYAVMARTFADARPGDVILYEDSYGTMSVAISRGSAGRMLHASPGQRIRITPRAYRASGDRWAPVGPGTSFLQLRGQAKEEGLARGRPDCLHPDRKAVARPVQRERHRGQPGEVRNGRERREVRVPPKLLDRSADAFLLPADRDRGKRERRREDDVRVLPERDDAPRRRLQLEHRLGVVRSRGLARRLGETPIQGREKLGIDRIERGADLPDRDEGVEQPGSTPGWSRLEGLVAEALEKRRRGLERRDAVRVNGHVDRWRGGHRNSQPPDRTSGLVGERPLGTEAPTRDRPVRTRQGRRAALQHRRPSG